MPEKNLDELQRRLYQWRRTAKDGVRIGHTVLAVPSLSLPFYGIQTTEQMLHYEERIFYLFHILRNPLNRLIVVTSSPVTETLVSYLLHLLPGVPHSHARRRLELIHVQDGSTLPLTQKILNRPALLTRLKRHLQQSPRASISCYTVTPLEEELATILQAPLHGPRAEHLRLTSNSGSRQLFKTLDIPHPGGSGEVQYIGDLARELVALAESEPTLTKACLKHNFSISGHGNAVVDLTELQDRLRAGVEVDNPLYRWVSDKLGEWTYLVHRDQTWQGYLQRFEREGGVVEEFVEGDPCTVEVRIDLDGTVDVIGTHDEHLAGTEAQTYQGCRFPASSRVSVLLGEIGLKLGRWMASEGVVGRFTANFLATPKGGSSLDKLYAVDVHLRKGNTTLPLRTLQLLTGGIYWAERGVFTDDRGEELSYISSDHFGGGQFKGMMPRDLLEIITCSKYHYSGATHTGAVFHMLNGISELGQTGITCIERNHDLAERLYYNVFQALDQERGGFAWMT